MNLCRKKPRNEENDVVLQHNQRSNSVPRVIRCVSLNTFITKMKGYIRMCSLLKKAYRYMIVKTTARWPERDQFSRWKLNINRLSCSPCVTWIPTMNLASIDRVPSSDAANSFIEEKKKKKGISGRVWFFHSDPSRIGFIDFCRRSKNSRLDKR